MKELSLNILDIAENSVKANATLTQIILKEDADTITISIIDDGKGMSEEILRGVVDPFYTTRTTRKVGLGLPLLKMAAEQTGGEMKISSKQATDESKEHGTSVTATFNKNHLDFTPLGDVASTIVTLIQGHPDTDFYFEHTYLQNSVNFDSREVRQVLGPEIPLNEYEILEWISNTLEEQYKNLYKV